MEENPEEKNNHVDGDDDPEEMKERFGAVFLLYRMKYSKIDIQTSNNISRIKSGIHGGGHLPLLPEGEEFTEATSWGEGLELNKLKVPEHGKPIDGLTPPKYPPVENLRGRIEKCGGPFEKQLTASDVKEDQSRLTITKDLVREFIDPVMSDEEKECSRKVDGIKVSVYDSDGSPYQMTFKMWSGGKSQVLTSGWKAFCKDNEFKALEDWITVWVFRHQNTHKLCFVILARRFPQIKQLVPKTKPRKSGNDGENASRIPGNGKRKQIE